MRENLSIFNSKKRNRIGILKLLIFVICLNPVLLKAGNAYITANSYNTVNTYNLSRFTDFYALEQGMLDMVFVGSSHSYCTFDPEIVDEILGINSFQMGLPWQHPDGTYFTIREILNYQHPKTIVMELYWDMLDDDFEFKQAEMLFQVMDNPELQQEYLHQVFPLNEIVKYEIPIIRYQQDFIAYQSKQVSRYVEDVFGVTRDTYVEEGEEYYRSKGYVYCDYQMPPDEFNKTNQFVGYSGKDFKISSAQKKYLVDIIRLCQSNMIDLIFVTAPVPDVSMEYIDHYEDIHEEVANFAAEHNIPYIDFNMLGDETVTTYKNFRDDAHMNHTGATIVSTYFAEWFRELEDNES